ncbi:hypothetical protein IMCC3317_03160 [Kordia antarctica]|uniref:Uncharacterized protein n=1 Tax=Kordia antarctica TaxID=1218801 RepID=A0A7L4ZEN4_9FLAO|nr:hypothetical protein [Kordia antarctica]QHI34970.1 hypothetical protein IMCC3317_03160 [Kordia antarctica]
MKKRKFKLLELKKHKISNLNSLNSKGGDYGNGETATVGTDTVPYLPTIINCPETVTCDTNDGGTCQTTRTLADNTFNETCDCDGMVTGANC